jgi:hypothetical protein
MLMGLGVGYRSRRQAKIAIPAGTCSKDEDGKWHAVKVGGQKVQQYRTFAGDQANPA